MRPTHTFTLDGKTFSVEALPLSKQLRLYALIAPIASVLAASFQGKGEPPSHLVAALDGLDEIRGMFVPLTKVDGIGELQGARPLAPFTDDVFARRAFVVLAYLVHCIKGELGDFLPGSGRTLESLLVEAGFSLPKARTGASTDSSSTPA